MPGVHLDVGPHEKVHPHLMLGRGVLQGLVRAAIQIDHPSPPAALAGQVLAVAGATADLEDGSVARAVAAPSSSLGLMLGQRAARAVREALPDEVGGLPAPDPRNRRPDQFPSSALISPRSSTAWTSSWRCLGSRRSSSSSVTTLGWPLVVSNSTGWPSASRKFSQPLSP